MAETYAVIVTDHAVDAIREIRDYIADVLLNPDAARRHMHLFHDEIKGLATMPKRIKRIEEQPWHDEGIRRLRTNNYYIYFWIDEDKKKVYVTDIIFVGRDQKKILETMSYE